MSAFAAIERQLLSIEQGLQPAQRRAGYLTAQAVHRRAIGWSSGSFKQPTFDTPVRRGGLGAPYGWGSVGWLGPRGAVPYGDAAIINAQTGLFRSSWVIREAWVLSGNHGFSGTVFIVANTAPYAEFLFKGTRLMIPRPIIAALQEEADRLLPIFSMQEIDALLKSKLTG